MNWKGCERNLDSIFKTVYRQLSEGTAGKPRKASGRFVYAQGIKTRDVNPKRLYLFSRRGGDKEATAEVLHMWKCHTAQLHFYYLRLRNRGKFILTYETEA
jgi:hypothetical protein